MAMTIPKDGKVIGCDISGEYYEVGKPFLEEVQQISASAKWRMSADRQI